MPTRIQCLKRKLINRILGDPDELDTSALMQRLRRALMVHSHYVLADLDCVLALHRQEPETTETELAGFIPFPL